MKRSILRTITYFSLAGLILPAVIVSIDYINGKLFEFDLVLGYWTEIMMLLLWPSSIILLPFLDWTRWFVVVLLTSILLNVFLYSAIGTFCWLGANRNRLYFIIPLIGLLLVWKYIVDLI